MTAQGCKGCVNATGMWCATCPVRARWEQARGLAPGASLADVRMGIDPMPRTGVTNRDSAPHRGR